MFDAELEQCHFEIKIASVGLLWLLRSSSKQLTDRSLSEGVSSPLCAEEMPTSLELPCFMK